VLLDLPILLGLPIQLLAWCWIFLLPGLVAAVWVLREQLTSCFAGQVFP